MSKKHFICGDENSLDLSWFKEMKKNLAFGLSLMSLVIGLLIGFIVGADSIVRLDKESIAVASGMHAMSDGSMITALFTKVFFSRYRG